MVNAEEVLKQKILDSHEEKHFKRQHQDCISYANRTLSDIIQHLYEYHVKISTIDIE